MGRAPGKAQGRDVKSKGSSSRWSDFSERRVFALVVRACWDDSRSGHSKRFGEVNVSRACREIETRGDEFSSSKVVPRAKVKRTRAALHNAWNKGNVRQVGDTWETTEKDARDAFYRVMVKLTPTENETSEQMNAREVYATSCVSSIMYSMAAAGTGAPQRYAKAAREAFTWALANLGTGKSSAA